MKNSSFSIKGKQKVILAGIVVGIIALVLTKMGNPANMGICTACFIRDTAGALKLQQTPTVQYVRPEIMGIVFGSCIFAFFTKQWKAQGGSSPVTRFILGICVMIGSLIFLGCPLRMALRIAGGDLNAVIGLFGFIAGVFAGVIFLKKGFSLKRNYAQPNIEKYPFVFLNILILLGFIVVPGLFAISVKGPGSMHAPLIISLVTGIVIGIVALWSRLCFVSGIRDSILFKDFTGLYGLIALVIVLMIGNIIFGNFHLGFSNQPIAHTNAFYNFGGLFVVGIASTLLGGCPLRQLILAGSGNSDSAITVIGLFAGAAIAHNFQLASTPEGPTANGKIAFWIFLAIVLLIGLVNVYGIKKEVKKNV